jgi:alkylated DNA repair protein alkB family protein 8
MLHRLQSVPSPPIQISHHPPTTTTRRFEYAVRGIDPAQSSPDPLPPWLLTPLVSRIADRAAALGAPKRLDQATVNEYTPGVGLSAHIDTHSAFEGAVLSLSLAGE